MTRLRLSALVAALGLTACAGGAARSADAPERSLADDAACLAADSTGDGGADIAISATVRARELRHAEAPRSSVRLSGTALADSLSCDTRSSLERPARAGRTYRDVRIDYRLRVRIDSTAARGDTTGRP